MQSTLLTEPALDVLLADQKSLEHQALADILYDGVNHMTAQGQT